MFNLKIDGSFLASTWGAHGDKTIVEICNEPSFEVASYWGMRPIRQCNDFRFFRMKDWSWKPEVFNVGSCIKVV